MAREFIDGFEAGSIELWDAKVESGSYPQIATGVAGVDGTYCMFISVSAQCYLAKDIVAANEKYFAFRFRVSAATCNRICHMYYNSTGLLNLYRNSTTGYIEAYIGASLVATGTKALNTNEWNLIEVYYKIADSGGRVVVKVGGITDIDYTGDTKPGADTQMNKFIIGNGETGVSKYCNGYYDNIIIDGADWIGDTKIQAIVPTAAGNATEWDPSTGSNWACVDEKPPDSADFVSTNVSDKVDLYTFGDLSGSIESVKCVQVQARALKEGSPTPTNLKLAARTGGTTYVSGDKAVPAVTPKALWNLWGTNPNTTNPWAASEVNGAEFGIKSAA